MQRGLELNIAAFSIATSSVLQVTIVSHNSKGILIRKVVGIAPSGILSSLLCSFKVTYSWMTGVVVVVVEMNYKHIL